MPRLLQQFPAAAGNPYSSMRLQSEANAAVKDYSTEGMQRQLTDRREIVLAANGSDTRWMQRYMAEIWKEQCMAIHFSAWQRRGLDAAVNDYNTGWRYDSARHRHKINGYQQRLVKPVKL